MASYIRKTLDADRFFEIPYEIPENIYKLPGESDAKAAERICNHTLVSVGVPCEYGKEIQLIGKQILHTMAIKNGHGS